MNKYCPNCGKGFPEGLEVCPDDGTPLLEDVPESLEGLELDGRYRVLERIGEGGMGVVYVAEQTMVGRRVALKVVRSSMARDRVVVRRFFQEARAIAGLKSAHTITLHDFGLTEEGVLYYAMEMLEGESLAELLRRRGFVTAAEAVPILRQVLDSLTEAHDAGILHRDLKPGNIFVGQRRGQLHATVLDFGIAKMTMDDSLESVTQTGQVCGTPAYVSPELALGKPASPASDLYALGIVLYEMLAGSPPFDGGTPVRLLMRHINEEPRPARMVNPDAAISDSMEQFLSVCLAKTPEERFATADEFAAAMEEALGSGYEAPAGYSVPPPTVGPSRGGSPSRGSSPLTNFYGTTVTDLPTPTGLPTVPVSSLPVAAASTRKWQRNLIFALLTVLAILTGAILILAPPWRTTTPDNAPDTGRPEAQGTRVSAPVSPDTVQSPMPDIATPRAAASPDLRPRHDVWTASEAADSVDAQTASVDLAPRNPLDAATATDLEDASGRQADWHQEYNPDVSASEADEATHATSSTADVLSSTDRDGASSPGKPRSSHSRKRRSRSRTEARADRAPEQVDLPTDDKSIVDHGPASTEPEPEETPEPPQLEFKTVGEPTGKGGTDDSSLQFKEVPFKK